MKIRTSIGLGLLLVVIAGVWLYLGRPGKHLYVFINETQDHRFDESIRTSIFAATKRTGVQNVVVIANPSEQDSTNPPSIEEEASRLFNELKVGRLTNGRGILYLFRPTSHELKIEVSYALESALPDAAIHPLEQAAKSFTFSDRYQDFWAELINTLNIVIYEREHRGGNQSYDFASYRFLSGGAGVSSRNYELTWKQWQQEFKAGTNRLAGVGAASSDLRNSLGSYLESLRGGDWNSDLDVLSFESRFFRRLAPRSSFQLSRDFQMYDNAGVDAVFATNLFAFVFFKPNQPVLPLILRREADRKWRVIEPLSSSLFQRFEDSMRVFLKFPLDGLPDGMNEYLKSKIGPELYPLGSPINFPTLIQSTPRFDDLRSAYFQLFWLERVESLLEKSGKDSGAASALDLWIATDSHLNLGHIAAFNTAYAQAVELFPDNKRLRSNLLFYRNLPILRDSEWTLTR